MSGLDVLAVLIAAVAALLALKRWGGTMRRGGRWLADVLTFAAAGVWAVWGDWRAERRERRWTA